jgi:ribose-phosphate pyrophosphokinase
MMAADGMAVFAGSGSVQLTDSICQYLDISRGKNQVLTFSEGNTFVRVLENVRGRHVYIVQSTVFPANDNFMELLFWIDALNRASAESVTAVIPYFSYGKGDKKDEPRVSIRARVCADAIEVAGADRVVTMDLHAAQIQGFFRVPVDNLYGMPVLCDRIEKADLVDPVVVAPDAGFVKGARAYASRLGAPVAIADKERSAHDEHAEVLHIIGEVRDRTAIIVDDSIMSGGTLEEVSLKLADQGAKEIYALITHGALGQSAVDRIDRSPVRKLFITDTIERQPATFSRKIEVVSVAAVFGEAIRRIHYRQSISEIFTQWGQD